MTAATITKYVETALPSVEVVQLTVTDGETFVSRKFKTLTGAVISGNEDNDAHINVTLSSATATINYAGMTDQKVTLILFGNHD
jgi:hypothetical protein